MNFVTLIAHLSEWLGVIAIVWILSISPRFRVPQVGFKYPRREGIMSLSVFGLITVVAYALYQFNPPQFLSETPLSMPPQTTLFQALLMAGVALIPVVVALVARGQPPKSAGWNPLLFMPAAQMGLAAGILTIFLRNRVFYVLNNLNSESITTLLFVIGIAIAEESVFRGYIQPRLSAWLGTWYGIAATAFLFATWHAIAWMGVLPIQTGAILFGLALAQGLVLGWIMYKSKHVIACGIYRAFSLWMFRF